MKRILALLATVVFLASTALADDLAKLEGKWTTKKTRPDGQTYTQVIEIKKDKFTFKVLRASDELAFFAEGKLKTETMAPFSVVKMTEIKAGRTEADTQSVDDDRVSIYQLADDTWTLVSNLDKERDTQKPSLDVYTRVKK